MSALLDDIASYSGYVYALRERHPFITGSTLTLAPIGATLAKLEGRIECQNGIHLEVWELVDFAEYRATPKQSRHSRSVMPSRPSSPQR